MGTKGRKSRATGQYGVKLVRGPFLKLPPHPQACHNVDDVYSVVGPSSRPLAIDLFCGAGGLSLGLEQAGFDVILGVDTDPEALETHRHHHAGLSVNWDLGHPDVIERVASIVRKARVTLVAGGPPCQPFSRAGRSGMRDLVRQGRRPPHDQRRDLWQSLLEIVELSHPPAVLMENVPDMALDRDMMVLRTMVERLEELGYAVDERIVDTWRVGVPQFRQRLILVALADGRAFTWPSDVARQVTVRHAIGDLPAVEGGWRPEGGADGWAEYDRPLTSFQDKSRAGVAPADRHKVFDHITRPVRDDDRLVFNQMTSDTRYSDVDEELRRYRADSFDDKYKRLDWDHVSRTITAHIAKDGYWYIHPDQPRTLTVREAARIQTFPDHVRFAGPPSSAFRQIGNAVPPQLGETIGRSLLQALKGPRHKAVTTTTVASELASWWAETDDLCIPWLYNTTRWGVIQAELLLDRATPAHVRSLWPLIAKFAEPEETIAAADDLIEMAGWIGREDRARHVLDTAAHFVGSPTALDTIDGMLSAPHVKIAVAELAVRVAHDDDEDPVIVSQGVLRLAARFSGLTVDRVNKRSAGRIAVARLVGAGELGDSAHLALLELAERTCVPRRPRCTECPLSPWCVEHAGEPRKTRATTRSR